MDEKSLNYGQLNAALVGAVKSLEIAEEGGRQRQDGLRVANGDQNGRENRWGGKFLS